jgi:site-specific DNA-methyltransferase (adenine-specific)/adenine-specific DNA-methyltransferase
VDAIAAELKEGKSEVVCEQGRLIKVIKDKQGIVTRESLTKRWTGGYIFENEWQSFRTRKDRNLELTTAAHTYDKPGRYTVAVKVIDIFGNDTMTLVPVTVG